MTFFTSSMDFINGGFMILEKKVLDFIEDDNTSFEFDTLRYLSSINELAGYFHDINNVLSLNPSLYLKSDGATSQLDINSNIVYTNQNNNQMWGGVSYRLDEGIILLAGMDITKDLRFGLGYDLTVLNSMSNSLEIMLGYNFKIKANKSLSGYKNPRFL